MFRILRDYISNTGPPQRGGPRAPAPAPVPQLAMVHFNLSTLSPDVFAQIQKHMSNELMTMNEMTPYVDVKPNITLDPTGNTMRFILDPQVIPQQIFTRSGKMYYFGPMDAKQEDRFIKNFPVCLLDTPPGRRHWYEHTVTHGVAHGMYMHDLFYFRFLSLTQQTQQSEFRGLTCGSKGDNDKYDLPLQA